MRAHKDHHITTHNKHLQQEPNAPTPAAKGWLTMVCFLLALGTFCRVEAETYVGGIVWGTWTKANSPYILTNNIQAGALEIHPGVTVSGSNFTFEVNDVFTAVGTEAEPIVFNARDPGVGWQGILLNNANILGSTPSCNMRWCIISNALNGGVRIVNTVPYFEHCTFANNMNSSGNGGGVYASMNQGSLAFQHCTFANNTSASGNGGGIYANLIQGDLSLRYCTNINNTSRYSGGGIYASLSTNTLVLESCEIGGNVANPSVNAGDYCGGGVCVVGSLQMRGCLVGTNGAYARSYNANRWAQGGGVYAEGPAQVSNSLFRGNTVYAVRQNASAYTHGGGMYLAAGPLSVVNCVFSDNTSSFSGAGGGSYGGGLSIGDSASAASVINCTLAYNNIQGLYSDRASAVVMSSILYSNYNGGTQIVGPTNVTYCCVQNGYSGTGNIQTQPFFANLADFSLSAISKCVDAGNPEQAFNDVCLAPCGKSLGTARNDMGAYGGPGACGWSSPCLPSIETQPSDQKGCLGHSATFTVVASGTPPLTYQWYSSAGEMSGQTNATLTLTNLQATDAGKYSMVVSNPYGSTSSSLANLTVFDACTDVAVYWYFRSYMYSGVKIGGLPGASYVLKCTSDLRNTDWSAWTPLATNTMDSSGWWFHLDTQSPHYPHRFYGAKLAP